MKLWLTFKCYFIRNLLHSWDYSFTKQKWSFRISIEWTLAFEINQAEKVDKICVLKYIKYILVSVTDPFFRLLTWLLTGWKNSTTVWKWNRKITSSISSVPLLWGTNCFLKQESMLKLLDAGPGGGKIG